MDASIKQFLSYSYYDFSNGSKSVVILGEEYDHVIYSEKIEKNLKNRKKFIDMFFYL
jgi:hypothetical protein